MAKSKFEPNNAGMTQFLRSDKCLNVVKEYAKKVSINDDMKAFIGFDRAKVFCEKKGAEK